MATAAMAPTAVAGTAAGVAVSTVVAACVAVASAEAAEPADTITNRASLILCFLPTAMAAFVRSDGDDDGGGSGDGGGCRSR